MTPKTLLSYVAGRPATPEERAALVPLVAAAWRSEAALPRWARIGAVGHLWILELARMRRDADLAAQAEAARALKGTPVLRRWLRVD